MNRIESPQISAPSAEGFGVRCVSTALAFVVTAALSLSAHAAEKAPAKAPAKATPAPPAASAAPVMDAFSGYVVNGGFEKTTPVDNLWDGVNFTGGLAGEVR